MLIHYAQRMVITRQRITNPAETSAFPENDLQMMVFCQYIAASLAQGHPTPFSDVVGYSFAKLPEETSSSAAVNSRVWVQIMYLAAMIADIVMIVPDVP